MPDSRHFRDQKYCSAPACRKASKKASHQRWLESDKGAEYRDPEEIKRRVREWRAVHPGYWKRKGLVNSDALQETKSPEPVDVKDVIASLAFPALQDLTDTQRVLYVGLIALLTGNTLQETIESDCHRIVLLGQDILDNVSGINPKGDRENDRKTDSVFEEDPENTPTVQLAGSSSGP